MTRLPRSISVVLSTVRQLCTATDLRRFSLLACSSLSSPYNRPLMPWIDPREVSLSGAGGGDAAPSPLGFLRRMTSMALRPFDRDAVLGILRNLPLPVVVVTAAAPKSSAEGDVTIRGITCTSFCSVSMDPPLVSVCIHRGSRFIETLHSSSGFAVHFLGEDDRVLANVFARPSTDHSATEFRSVAGEWAAVPLEDPGGASGTPAAGDREGMGGEMRGGGWVPVLGSPPAVLLCCRQSITDVGDHCMLLGRAVAAGQRDSNNHRNLRPLLYVNRQYHALGVPL